MTWQELRAQALKRNQEASELLGGIPADATTEVRRAALEKAKDLREQAELLELQAETAKRMDESRAAMNVTEAATQSVNVRDNREDAPWGVDNGPVTDAFGEYLGAVRSAFSNRGAEVDPRLRRSMESRASGQNEGMGGDGGFLVDTQFATEIWQRVEAQAVLAPRCTNLPVGANFNGIKIPYVDEESRARGSRWGGIRAYWLAEAATKLASKIGFKRWELSLEKIAALGYVTDELLQDRALMGSLLLQSFSDEIAFEIDNAIFRGPGAGMPLGIMNSGSLITVAKESAQAADSIVWKNVAKMVGKMAAPNFRSATWYIDQTIWAEILTMTTTASGDSGQPLFVPPGRIADAPYGMLYGRPIQVIEHTSAAGEVGDVLFADLSDYILIRKGGLQTAQSIHVKFDTDETAFRTVARVNGAPKWDKPLTLAHGGSSVSSFVTLAAR